MTVQEIHEHIWKRVRDAAEGHQFPLNNDEVSVLKKQIVHMLHFSQKISRAARDLLIDRSCCVACVLYNYDCHRCPICCATGFECSREQSPFKMVIYAKSAQEYERGCDKLLAVNILNGNYSKKNKDILESEIMEALDEEQCKQCIHGDDDGNCVSKSESPFNSFICDHNEQFEEA